MKKKTVMLFILVVTAFSLIGCGESSNINANTNINQPSAYFERHDTGGVYSILVDKETGVCYLESKYINGAGSYGLTVMLNADGTPKIWKEDQDKDQDEDQDVSKNK